MARCGSPQRASFSSRPCIVAVWSHYWSMDEETQVPVRRAARYGSRRRIRPLTALAVLLLHAALGVFLLRAFTPDLVASIASGIGDTLTTVDMPEERRPPPPAPAPDPAPPREEGAAAPAGKRAEPRAVSAPKPPVVLTEQRAPPVSGAGAQDASGARDEGEGTGDAGAGEGTGSGQSGLGSGGGGRGTPTVKIAGDISAARDYARKGRELRLGHFVVIDLDVGTDGRVAACRVSQASPDPEADRRTCELASQRFRFRPATDASGRPVPAIFRWKQRWFCC